MKKLIFILAVLALAAFTIVHYAGPAANGERTDRVDRAMPSSNSRGNSYIKGAQMTAGNYTKPPKEELKRKLTGLQYEVTQECGTEPAFNNEYWDNKKEGIYVDRVSGDPLFSSLDKFDSGTGWPSFTKALNSGNLIEKEDRTLAMTRTEVRSRKGHSHLGHVFDDGPAPSGKRYCMNSASLRFVPREDLEKEGYGEYLKLFKK